MPGSAVQSAAQKASVLGLIFSLAAANGPCEGPAAEGTIPLNSASAVPHVLPQPRPDDLLKLNRQSLARHARDGSNLEGRYRSLFNHSDLPLDPLAPESCERIAKELASATNVVLIAAGGAVRGDKLDMIIDYAPYSQTSAMPVSDWGIARSNIVLKADYGADAVQVIIPPGASFVASGTLGHNQVLDLSAPGAVVVHNVHGPLHFRVPITLGEFDRLLEEHGVRRAEDGEYRSYRDFTVLPAYGAFAYVVHQQPGHKFLGGEKGHVSIAQ